MIDLEEGVVADIQLVQVTKKMHKFYACLKLIGYPYIVSMEGYTTHRVFIVMYSLFFFNVMKEFIMEQICYVEAFRQHQRKTSTTYAL